MNARGEGELPQEGAIVAGMIDQLHPAHRRYVVDVVKAVVNAFLEAFGGGAEK